MEWEWLVTLATLEPDDLIYTDFVEAARELVSELQDEVWNYPFIIGVIPYMYMYIVL